jgi:hypothetical protein
MFPQLPQLLLSVAMSTHRPPQKVWPPGHPHEPFVQGSPPVHTVPQAPQLFTLESTSMQLPPQSRWPVGHTHAPATQVVPPAQRFPQ